MTSEESNTTEGGGRRVATQVTSLTSLIGAHPATLEKMYKSLRPADPAELGDAPRGRILAIAPAGEIFMMTRPFVRALASDHMPWSGKTFDHGGNSGQNVVFGKKVFRFRTEVVASEIDGRPTLRLSYSDPAYKNPWPVRSIVDELRGVGPGVAFGPVFLTSGAAPKLLVWFGLESRQAGAE